MLLVCSNTKILALIYKSDQAKIWYHVPERKFRNFERQKPYPVGCHIPMAIETIIGTENNATPCEMYTHFVWESAAGTVIALSLSSIL